MSLRINAEFQYNKYGFQRVIYKVCDMNIVRKKLETGSRNTGNLSNSIDLFSPLHIEWAQQLSKSTNIETLLHEASFTVGSFKSLSQNKDGLFYGLGNKNNPCQILIELSANITKSVVETKFGSKSNDKYTLSVFDLILMQTFAKTALAAFTNLGISNSTDKIISRCIGSENIGQMEAEILSCNHWLCIDLPFKTDEKSSNTDKTITLYLAEPLINTLNEIVHSKQNNKAIDPTNPWSSHMRNMIMESTQMVEVVIEDVTMSIADCTRLEIGQIINLPGASHTRLDLKVRTNSDIQNISNATLGMFKSNKAVKLLDDIDPSFLAGFADVEQRRPST